MRDRFVTDLYLTKVGRYYPIGAQEITDIIRAQGYNPTKCVVRGYTGENSVKRAAQSGDDAPIERDSLHGMEIRRRWRWKHGTLTSIYEFRDSDDVVPSPTQYASREKISGLSVYERRKLKKVKDKRYLWKFRKGFTPKEALLGMIIVAEPAYVNGYRTGRRFDGVVTSARRDINL